MAKKKRRYGQTGIISGIISAVLIVIIAVMLFLYFSFNEIGSAPKILGFTIYQTKAVNMMPEVPADTAVIAKESEIANIKVGSAILYKTGDSVALTRVVQILSENGNISYVVRFDTSADTDTTTITEEDIVAKAMWYSEGLGNFLSFVTSSFGIMLMIIIPCFIIILLQVIRIVNIKKAEEDARSTDDFEDFYDQRDNGGFTFSAPKVEADENEKVEPKKEEIAYTKKVDDSPLLSYTNTNIDIYAEETGADLEKEVNDMFNEANAKPKKAAPKKISPTGEKKEEKKANIATPLADAFQREYGATEHTPAYYKPDPFANAYSINKKEEEKPVAEQEEATASEDTKEPVTDKAVDNILDDFFGDDTTEATESKPVEKAPKKAKAKSKKEELYQEELDLFSDDIDTAVEDTSESVSISDLMNIISQEESKLKK